MKFDRTTTDVSSHASDNHVVGSEAAELSRLIANCWISQAICVAARLGIADHLSKHPMSPEDLARVTSTHAPALRRLLKALVTIEVCRECEEDVFGLGRLGKALCTDSFYSARFAAIYCGEHFWQLWGNLLSSIRTGETARRLLMGKEGLDHIEQDQSLADTFNRAMQEQTRRVAKDILAAYDFRGSRQIVDVGGGCGELLAAILGTQPHTTGVLYERAHAVEGARRTLDLRGVGTRCRIVTGDFFKSVPAGGDTYILKSVIHDWDDERSSVILKNCRNAMSKDSKVLLVERIMPERLELSADHRTVAGSDLAMLIGPGGHERTQADFRRILDACELRLTRTVGAGMDFSVIEAVPLASPRDMPAEISY
jgi:orsellinic acid C2-O-methyltransferase